jgi:type II secretory pathway component PulM
MKEWWSHLSLRDKRIACLGISFVFIILLYSIILLPFIDKNKLLRTQIQHDKSLLVWMKAVNQQIKTLQKSPSISISHTDESPLSMVQNEMKANSLAGKLTQLKQAESDSVQLNFQSLHFDELITWLTQISQRQGLVVAQTSITSIDSSGTVNAEITLKKA